jgi:plasmid stabilization system protein ParE
MNVVYDREAEDDVVDAAAWYDEQSAGLGEAFLAAIHRCAEALPRRATHRRHPIHGHRGVMVAMVHRFPYRLFYLVDDGSTLVVFAVAHDGRHPDYWVHRLRR